MHKQIWIGWLLTPILLFSFFFRIYNLGSNPVELFSDEITQVLSARSIIETGKDINGEANLFLYNKIKLGTPLFGYLSAISTYILGNNPLAVRLPAAIAGTISVLFMFLITNHLTKNKLVSLLAGFFAGIVPWGIYFSRIAWEPALTVPFILLSIYTLLKALEENSKKLILTSFVFFGLSVYASDALEFLAPLFLFTILLINYRAVFKDLKTYVFSAFVLLLILIPLIYVSFTNPLKHDRSFKISTFKEGINKQTINIFFENYKGHFNYDFLFKKGDPNLRHGTGTDGVLYPILLPFIVFGLFDIFKKYKNKNKLLLIFWLAYFPLGGSLTNDGVPHATRTLIGYPIFIIIAALGMGLMFRLLKNKNSIRALVIFVFIISLMSFKIFFNNYFNLYPINSQSWWEYGQSEVYKEVNRITIGNESLCLGNIDHWHEETLNHYYLGLKFKHKILYDLNDTNCLLSDVLVLPSNFGKPSNYRLESIIFDLQRNPKWNVYKFNK